MYSSVWYFLGVLLIVLCIAETGDACHIHLDETEKIRNVQCTHGVGLNKSMQIVQCVDALRGDDVACGGTQDVQYRHECKIHYTKDKDRNYIAMNRAYDQQQSLDLLRSSGGAPSLVITSGVPFWRDNNSVLYTFQCYSDIPGAVLTYITFSPDRNASDAQHDLWVSAVTIHVDRHIRMQYYLAVVFVPVVAIALCVVAARCLLNAAGADGRADLESQHDAFVHNNPKSSTQSVMSAIRNLIPRRKFDGKNG